jgi:hypothetical protein
MNNKPTHGGKRKGAGRKPALLPSFNKKLRASRGDRDDFMNMLTGDATEDFNILYVLLLRQNNRKIPRDIE